MQEDFQCETSLGYVMKLSQNKTKQKTTRENHHLQEKTFPGVRVALKKL
jgi:hypothetical protein